MNFGDNQSHARVRRCASLPLVAKFGGSERMRSLLALLTTNMPVCGVIGRLGSRLIGGQYEISIDDDCVGRIARGPSRRPNGAAARRDCGSAMPPANAKLSAQDRDF